MLGSHDHPGKTYSSTVANALMPHWYGCTPAYETVVNEKMLLGSIRIGLGGTRRFAAVKFVQLKAWFEEQVLDSPPQAAANGEPCKKEGFATRVVWEHFRNMDEALEVCFRNTSSI